MDDSKTVEKADREIGRMGLPLPKRPENEAIEWPNNVADLTTEQLAEHLSWWAGWAAFARYQLARAETNAEAYSEHYSYETHSRIFKSKGDHGSVTELKAAISQMPDMVQIKSIMLEAEAIRRAVRSLLEGYEEKHRTISREITRRGVDTDQDERRGRYRV